MAITGQRLGQIINIKADVAYTGYFGPTKTNILIQEAVIKAIETKTATNDSLMVRDDLFGIYKTNQLFTPVSNEVDITPTGVITDYYHLLNLKCSFTTALSGVYISAATNTNPIRITLSNLSKLRTSTKVVVSGVTTNTNANGVRYLKQLSPYLYELYSNILLSNPVAGNGSYIGTTGQIAMVNENYAGEVNSQNKPSRLNEPDIVNPGFEVSDGVIKIYPLTNPCSEVSVDYISVPVFPDIGDNTTDLLDTYSERFLYFIADKTCELMAFSSRDAVMANNEQVELIRQP